MDRINLDYVKSYNELILLNKIRFKRLKPKPIKKIKNVLIINSCLIGDFIVSVHAIRKFIEKNKANVDIIVPSTIKPIAERVIGINKVYTSKSICDRETEKSGDKINLSNLPEYDLVLVMRISKDSYNLLKKIRFRSIKTYLKPLNNYAKNTIKSTIKKKNFKQWRTFNFEIIGEKEKVYDFVEIFNIKKSDYEKVKKFPEMKGKSKKIIIHTGSGWPIKFWDNNKWAELLKKINSLGKFKFIFMGATKQEKDAFDEIQSKVSFKICSLIKKVDIFELMLILKLSDYFIGVDSGPRNLANLVSAPSVCLFGPGPKIYMPINKSDVIIDKSNCFCLNYFCYKRKTCMQKIEVGDVLDGFKIALKLNRTGTRR